MQVSQAVSTLLLSFSLPEEAFRARKLGVVGSPFVPAGGWLLWLVGMEGKCVDVCILFLGPLLCLL